MAHDPIKLHIQISKVPKSSYWKTQDGQVMLTIDVHERREPSEKGTTHYATVYNKEAAKKEYVAYGKFNPFPDQTVSSSELPPTADDLVSDAQVVKEGENEDLPF